MGLEDHRDRLAKSGLKLAPKTTRLTEFGRFAARNRMRPGVGKPGTFQSLGFTQFTFPPGAAPIFVRCAAPGTGLRHCR
jgi:hypothetical protein